MRLLHTNIHTQTYTHTANTHTASTHAHTHAHTVMDTSYIFLHVFNIVLVRTVIHFVGSVPSTKAALETQYLAGCIENSDILC